MRKPAGILGSIAKRAQNNATRNAKKATYMLMWGEEPSKQKQKKKKS